MAKRRLRRGRRRKRGNWFSRLSIGKKIGVCFGGVVLALAASGVVYVAAKFGKLDTKVIPKEDIVINEGVEELGSLGEGYLNVALFGVDSREGDLDKNTRTDSIIIASLNKETKEIKMVSVYRDTLLDLSEGTLQKCNAAYSLYKHFPKPLYIFCTRMETNSLVKFICRSATVFYLIYIDIISLAQRICQRCRHMFHTACNRHIHIN